MADPLTDTANALGTTMQNAGTPDWLKSLNTIQEANKGATYPTSNLGAGASMLNPPTGPVKPESTTIPVSTITSNEQPMNVVQPTPVPISTVTPTTDLKPATTTYSTPDMSGTVNVPQPTGMELTPSEKRAQALYDKIGGLVSGTTGEAAFRAQKEQEAGLSGMIQTQNDLQSRLGAIQREAQAIPLQLQQSAEGRGITAGGLAPIQTAALRNNAIQALTTSSLLEASRGNISTAMTLVDRAVQQQFGPAKEEIDALTKNLNLIINSPQYSVDEKNRAQAQLDIQNQRKAQLEGAQQNYKDIMGIATISAKNGADAQTLDAITNANSPEEALSIASARGVYQAKNVETIKRADGSTVLYDKNTGRIISTIGGGVSAGGAGYIPGQNPAVDAWVSQINAGKATIANVPANIKNAVAVAMAGGTTQAQPLALAQAKSNIDDISSALTSSNLADAVGPNTIARIGFWSPFTGGKQNFIGTVEQLRSQLSLDSLVNAKARGATFGALSDSELKMLNESASKIGRWAIKDKNGNVVGYNVDEGSFKKELDRIGNFAKLDYVNKGGNPEDVGVTMTPDGKMWAPASDGSITQIN